MLVGNGCGFLVFETPKSALSQELIDEKSSFFDGDTNLGKLKVLGKIWFLKHGLKCSRSIRLHNF